MSAPTLLPVNVALAVRRAVAILSGTAAAPEDPTGTRAAAVAALASVLTERGTGGVYANILPESMPSRAVLVRRAKVPGEARGGVHTPSLATNTTLHVLYLADASEGDPAVVLERLHQQVFAALHEAPIGYPGHSGDAMRLYLAHETTGMERYDDRHVFSAAFGACALYSLQEA